MSKTTEEKLTKLFQTAGDKLTQGLQETLAILPNQDLRRGVNIFFATTTSSPTNGVWSDESGKPVLSLKNSWATGHSGYATIDALLGLASDERVTKISLGRPSLPLVRPRTEPKLAMAV